MPDQLLAANARFADSFVDTGAGPRPARGLAVVTCMDARLDVFAMLGLAVGDAHVIRNAGARVTEDVLRSLALSVHLLGVRRVALIQHTECGLAGVTDEELQARTGADLDFLSIDDHRAVIAEDVRRLAATPFLDVVDAVDGYLVDIRSGRLEPVTSERPSAG